MKLSNNNLNLSRQEMRFAERNSEYLSALQEARAFYHRRERLRQLTAETIGVLNDRAMQELEHHHASGVRLGYIAEEEPLIPSSEVVS